MIAPAPYTFARTGRPGGNGVFTVVVRDGNGRNIATVYGGHANGEKEATARLFAAAPLMLAALLDIAAGDPTVLARERVNAAIMAATGDDDV